MECQQWDSSKKRIDWYRRKKNEHMSSAQFIKLYIELDNTITKWASSLSYYGAKPHGDCSSFITGERVCMCLCICSTPQGAFDLFRYAKFLRYTYYLAPTNEQGVDKNQHNAQCMVLHTLC